MSLENDPRTGRAESGTVTIASADGTAPQTVLQIPSDALFRPTHVKVEYNDDGSVTEDLELYDESDGTAAGNVSDKRDTFPNVDADTLLEFDGPWREFENDVLVKTVGGGQDGDIEVSVYGYILSDLKDVSGF